jgi:hypothetical protein
MFPGPSLEWINKLKSYWQDTYSWPEAQKQVSEWHHFTTEVENLKVHFIHEKARTRQSEAIPLLLVHGWPGTFFELSDGCVFERMAANATQIPECHASAARS